MARRNPMNERYQKNTAPAGKTRKSAASAKPKRPVSETASKPAAKAKPRAKTAPSAVAFHPPTPEYQRLRKVWWGLLLASLAVTGASFLLMKSNQKVGTYLVFGAYLFLGGALYLDLVKLRKMRKEYQASGGVVVEKAEKPMNDDTAEKS